MKEIFFIFMLLAFGGILSMALCFFIQSVDERKEDRRSIVPGSYAEWVRQDTYVIGAAPCCWCCVELVADSEWEGHPVCFPCRHDLNDASEALLTFENGQDHK